MKEKNKKDIKKILILVCMCIILFIFIYEIIHIYAVFYSEMVGNIQFQNGTWNILVNGTEISKGVETKFVIDRINIQEDSHVMAGKLAPGLLGNFEITINPQHTNVAVRYDLSLNQENLKNQSLQIKSVKEIQEGETLIKTAENTYTGIIPLEKIKSGVFHKIKTEIEWIDNEQNSTEDTKLGVKYDSKLEIPITVHACQYLGEEITPYEAN